MPTRAKTKPEWATGQMHAVVESHTSQSARCVGHPHCLGHPAIIVDMSWIDDDADELKRREQSAAELEMRNQQIREKAEKIYNELWDEIIVRITEATNKGRHEAQHLMTNGDPYERHITRPGHTIIVPQPIKPGNTSSNPEYVKIALSTDRLMIVVSGLRNAPLHFPLDLCDDGVVRLKHEGEHKAIQEAAALVLRPILFPSLYPPK